MGLFSFVGKGLGKLAKAGLSIATRGASDKVFHALKSRGEARPLSVKLKTHQQAALANKLLQGVKPPSAQRIERVMSDAEDQKYGFSATPYFRAEYNGKPKYTTASRTKRQQRQPKPRQKRGGTLRKGMLDFATMAAQWGSAGKPMSWPEWIRTNPRHIA